MNGYRSDFGKGGVDPHPTLREIDIVKELKNVLKSGFVKSLRSGDTGIGYTLETLLGIKENNSGLPDFKYKGLPVELKTQRGQSRARVTLMTKTPNWDPLKPKEIMEKFGYGDSRGRKALKSTLTPKKFNKQGFKISLRENSGRLDVVHREYGTVAYFKVNDLMGRLKKKLYKNLILVSADRIRKESKERFLYNKAVLLQGLSEESFSRIVQ